MLYLYGETSQAITSCVIKITNGGDLGAILDIHTREIRGKTMNIDARTGRKQKVIYVTVKV